MHLDLADIQGLFARGYKGHRYARFTTFAAREPTASQALLKWLLPQVANAAPFSGDTALHIAFTPAGLRSSVCRTASWPDSPPSSSRA